MQNFNVDISAPGGPLVFYAMQADSLSRFFTLTITDGGEAWDSPDGALWSVRFGAPRMPSGWYDTIEDATDATHPAVNVATGVATVATVEIAEQALSTPGQNILCVLVTDSSGYQIASWPIILSIQAVPGLTAPEVTTYYNLLTGQVAQTLQNAQAAAASATLAESWAVGGTGTRDGEDTNNSEYWAQKASESAQEAVGFRTFQGGAVLPINGDADLTQPLPTKTAASISVTSNENRIYSVTVNGFTTQEGSGDPSPTNVREIKNAGICNKKIVINKDSTLALSGAGSIVGTSRRVVFQVTDLPLVGFSEAGYVICDLLPTKISEETYGKDEYGISVQHDESSQGIGFRVPGCMTVKDYQEWLTDHPLTVAYLSTEDTGKHYTGIKVTQGEDYHCTIVEINDRLHEGDTLETNVESEYDSVVTLTGEEAYNHLDGWRAGVVGIPSLLADAVKVTGYETIADAMCSHLTVAKPSTVASGTSNMPCFGQGGTTGDTLFLYLGSAYNSTELAKQRIKALYAAGTPIRVFYKSAAGNKHLQRVKRSTYAKRTLVLTGTETITSGTSQSKMYFLLQGVNVKVPSAMGEVGSVKCNMLAPVAQNDVVKGDYRTCITSNGNILFHFTDDVTTVEQAQQILAEKYSAGTPVTLEYELAQPEVYADTPVSVENPKGAYTVSGEDGTAVEVYVRTTPTPEEIGALPVDGTAQAATKLASPVNIGSASFDGTADITLAQMGAQPVLSVVTEDITSSCTGTNLDISFVHHLQYGKLHILYIEANNTATAATWSTTIAFPSKVNIPTRESYHLLATGSGFLDPQWYPIVAENSSSAMNKLFFRETNVQLKLGIKFEIAVVYMEP